MDFARNTSTRHKSIVRAYLVIMSQHSTSIKDVKILNPNIT